MLQQNDNYIKSKIDKSVLSERIVQQPKLIQQHGRKSQLFVIVEEDESMHRGEQKEIRGSTDRQIEIERQIQTERSEINIQSYQNISLSSFEGLDDIQVYSQQNIEIMQDKLDKKSIDNTLSRKKIGKTDISKWERHWDYAFIPSKFMGELNKLEAKTYLEYIQQIKVIQQWDKPPKFQDEYLTLLCENVYNMKIETLKKMKDIDESEIQAQTKSLRILVAKMLYHNPQIEDPQSRAELYNEIIDELDSDFDIKGNIRRR